MNKKLNRKVFVSIKNNVLMATHCRDYKFKNFEVSAYKNNVRLFNKETELLKIANSCKTLETLVNTYEELRQIGMIIWLLGYYSFQLDKTLDVKKHVKLFEEIEKVTLTQSLNLSPDDIQIRQLRESLEQAANRINAQINFWSNVLPERNGDR